MIILSLQHIQKSFGIHTVLNDISLNIHEGQKLGIVGNNGAGKSTLFKIIAGELSSDGGQISFAKGLSIGYLSQENSLSSDLSIWDELLQVFEPVFEIERELRSMEERMGTLHDRDPAAYKKLVEEYSRLSDSFQEKGGYSYQSFIQGVLIGLGFSSSQFQQPIYQLSGGQKTRVALAKLLLQKPDLLLLDEPTNHLDLEAIQWLEDYLKAYKGAVLVISHDRYFLDKLCQSIAEIANEKLELYDGNYSQYIKQRTARFQQQMKQYELQQKEIQRQQAIIDRYRSYNREKSIRAAESREKALARIERIEKPVEEQNIFFSFDILRSTGKDVLTVEGLSKSFTDKPLFENVSFSLRAGDRVALLGPNGIGKSTLFKILLGKVPYDQGSFKMGSNVQIGYYDQEQSELNPQKTVLQEVWDAHPKLNQTEIRNALAAFLFQGDDVYQPISTLSGGEKGRVTLVKLMLAKDNFLLLDEPTNHLDMASKERLEEALRDYPGTIFTISHDRYFINRIANRIMVLTAEGVEEYLGNYDDYLYKKSQSQNQPDTRVEEAKTKTALREERRRDRLARQEIKYWKEQVERIEKEIMETEEKISELEEMMCHPDAFSNPESAQELSKRYQDLKNHLETLYSTWEEVHEKAND